MRTLKKDIWPHQVCITMPDSKTVSELISLDVWCSQSLGRRFVDWYSYNSSNSKQTRVYAFKDEATLLVFKLTWGNYGTW